MSRSLQRHDDIGQLARRLHLDVRLRSMAELPMPKEARMGP
jgi:hypothetical protein